MHPKNKTTYKTLNKIAADPRVLEIWEEDGGDGIWISLVEGYNCEGASCVHEWTVKALINNFNCLVEKGPTY
jgi:hypothetical protein